MIDIPELGEEQHELWIDLIELARSFPGQWTIIGGHMVALYAWEAELRPRPSPDVSAAAAHVAWRAGRADPEGPGRRVPVRLGRVRAGRGGLSVRAARWAL